MDALESASRRELEQLKRFVRDREMSHAREIDELRKSQGEQIADLNTIQQSNLKNVAQKAQDQLELTRSQFDNEIKKSTDSFDRSINEQRINSYDKFGRMVAENARERNRQQQIAAQQIAELGSTDKHSAELDKQTREGLVNRIRDNYEKDRLSAEENNLKRMESQTKAYNEMLAQASQDSRAKVDKQIQSNSAEIDKAKLASEMKYQQLVDSSMAERESLVAGLKEREKQLADDKTLATAKAGQSGNKALEEYREKVGQSLEKVVNDNNVFNSKKDLAHAAQVSSLQRESQAKLQDTNSQFRKMTADLKYQNAAEKDRIDLKQGIEETRHKQEMYMNTEAIRQNNAIAQDALKRDYSEQLRALEERNLSRQQELARQAQERLNTQERRIASEQSDSQTKKNSEIKELSQRHDQEKRNIVRAYEEQKNHLETLNKRQIDEQKQANSSIVMDLQSDINKRLEQQHRQTRSEIYNLQQALKSQSIQAEELRKAESQTADFRGQERAKRLTQNYYDALKTQKESFDETADSIRQESQTRLAQIRDTSDHEKRMQLLDAQSKHRMIMTSFESQLNQIKDEHQSEMTKTRQDHEKQMRDVLKRTKDTVETERTLHLRELEARDRLMKEKLKLQEDMFKEQIEKLKRTNELALKKS